MQFEWYTEKTVSQCMKELAGRMNEPGTSRRPPLDGWVEKGGKFALAVSSKVGGRFTRKTRLHGQVVRESGVTVVRGSVPSGATREGQAIAFGAMLLVGMFIMANGDFMLGLVAAFMGAVLYFIMAGDSQNSETLLKELRKALNAKERPPKKPSDKTSRRGRASARK